MLSWLFTKYCSLVIVGRWLLLVYVGRLVFLYLLQGSAGRRTCCLTVVSHGGWVEGWVRPVGESVPGPLKGSALTHLQTRTVRENSEAHGSGLHLRRKSVFVRFWPKQSTFANNSPSDGGALWEILTINNSKEPHLWAGSCFVYIFCSATHLLGCTNRWHDSHSCKNL